MKLILELEQLALADQVAALDGAGALDAAKALVQAEKNFNPFAVTIPSFCSDVTLPATAALRGILVSLQSFPLSYRQR